MCNKHNIAKCVAVLLKTFIGCFAKNRHFFIWYLHSIYNRKYLLEWKLNSKKNAENSLTLFLLYVLLDQIIPHWCLSSAVATPEWEQSKEEKKVFKLFELDLSILFKLFYLFFV